MLAIAGGVIVLAGLFWILASRGLLGGFLDLDVSACHTDDEVAQSERAPYETAALNFTRTLLAGKTDDVPAGLSALARQKIGKDKIAQMVQVLSSLSGMAGTLRVAHSYQHKISGTGSADDVEWNGCTLVAHGSSDNGQGDVEMFVRKIPLQAYVIVNGDLRDTRYATYLWLVPENGGWFVNYFYVSTAGMGGRAPADFRTLASEQAKKGHNFNAYVLDAVAVDLLNGGPNFKFGLTDLIDKDIAALTLPADVSGKAPFTWKAGVRSFRITDISVNASGKNLVLHLQQELPQWGVASFLEAENQALLAALHANHPEYRDVFGSVTVNAVGPGHPDGYRTVETVQ